MKKRRERYRMLGMPRFQGSDMGRSTPSTWLQDVVLQSQSLLHSYI